jgi:hypothetical protein
MIETTSRSLEPTKWTVAAVVLFVTDHDIDERPEKSNNCSRCYQCLSWDTANHGAYCRFAVKAKHARRKVVDSCVCLIRY